MVATSDTCAYGVHNPGTARQASQSSHIECVWLGPWGTGGCARMSKGIWPGLAGQGGAHNWDLKIVKGFASLQSEHRILGRGEAKVQRQLKLLLGLRSEQAARGQWTGGSSHGQGIKTWGQEVKTLVSIWRAVENLQAGFPCFLLFFEGVGGTIIRSGFVKISLATLWRAG